ncbi:acyl-CoA dehydrogenase family protein [Pseudonocardia sp. N23]|uniref:acyl-CoA dehydrogenase family protein n=1 Tax=Pseudonocardia sp. N23 TaxID=1987376 RepID=UPI000BFEA679|nr:acyl-CoA dehydrogenase family protein [Pseudonocardia sp. N23]GAY07104.1 butyryl-CoA dehydrogenase [Pseudonocardia sp. N23]
MFFALTDDQREFGTAVTTYLAERFDLDAVRGVVEDTAGDGHPVALWKAAGEQGWLAVTVPEEHDGLGLGLVEAQVIARALGAGVAPGPWRGTVLAAEAIRLAGSAEQQAAWLPRLAAGEAVGALSLRAPGAAVEYAGIADVVVVRSGDGLALVERGGFTAQAAGSYDGTTRLATVTVDGAGEPLPGADAAAIADLTARATVLVASDLAGVAREAITRTVAYDREREQFGVPVGSFQAIKHALADLHVGVTMAEHAVLYAAHAAGTGAEDADLAVAVAKAKASDAAAAATAAMIQYHGGIGYTWEHEAHLFYKRAKRLAGQYGDADAQRERIATLTIG